MASASKPELLSAGSAVSGFGPHIEELRAFFVTRDVRFGAAEDLQPFVERLESDASFRDEMASMVRAIIYRERDGLSRPELMELLATAVGGEQVDNAASPEVREAVRRLMAFVEGVFRSRRDPGAARGVAMSVAAPVNEVHESDVAVVPVVQEMSTAHPKPLHPTTDLFYRAQVVAQGGVAEAIAEERRAEAREDAARDESVVIVEEPLPVPQEDAEAAEPARRTSRFWIWAAVVCGLMLAFCAGLSVHQHLLVPLRDPNQPYETTTPEDETTAAQPGGATTTAVQPSPASPSGTARAAQMPDQGLLTERVPARRRAGAVAAADGATTLGSEADLQRRYMSPGMIGASPALMASYLRYAPPAEYPGLAKMAHIQGQVMVQAVVGKDGRVIRAVAISGHRLLRGAAVREVYQRRYRPYTLDDRPRDVATIVTVDFRLK